jgi:hypothetical protein
MQVATLNRSDNLKFLEACPKNLIGKLCKPEAAPGK